jgi:hypothetical protein
MEAQSGCRIQGVRLGRQHCQSNRMILSLLKRQVVSERSLARVGQGVAFVGAGLIPVLVFRRFAEVEMFEGQLLIGVVATMSLAILCAMLGMLLDSRTKVA